ncbi:carboxypeptidase-like protein [Algoriphagus boseongensis]|uniref:Carboxypeptidase-like protein n=1 Tax=Algoriphagus boseongensis TaxID=1442587 RepID=A0A4R6T921_9BACT|nr:carboxypeptidase-like regulatory domain-containing protein [Algoriphagus boseongensis]TDQ18729.1 carboxypeptidase-like protein [Algoriphagus boseongensis]
MRRIVFLILCFISFLAESQTISGVVKEKGSGLPLPFANVFVNNSTLGAATDVDGNFTITGKIPEEFELVASFVGYKTVSQTIQRKGRQSYTQNFELEFLEDNLSEVELKAKRDRSWERTLKMFKEVFLAVPDDPYGKDIEILNPWVLDFEKVNPDKGFNYIQATAVQPLQVVNKALGYQIDYHLQDFRMLRNASRFFGQAFYRELDAQDSVTQNEWEQNKGLNYQSSVRHFALSLLLKNSGVEGFDLYRANPNIPKEDRTNDFYYELGKSILPVQLEFVYVKPLGNGVYRIFLPERIEIHHLNKPWPNDYYENIYHAISWVVAPSGYFDVDRNGTLMHPTQLVLSGFMGRQRLARSLPLDFVPDERFSGLTEDLEVFHSRHLKLNNLREKPWLTFSKPTVYPGETLWFGGKMLYQNPISQDSLSRTLYVEIMDSKFYTVQKGIFPIQQGKVSGGFVLPDSLPAGDYLMRAYTRWSLNFPEKDMFQLPFPVISQGQMLKTDKSEQEALFGDIVIEPDFVLSDSLNYRVLELELKFQDSYENLVDANFLISATQNAINMEFDPKFRLENAMNWLDEDLPETFDSELAFPIEYGISVEGVYVPTRKRDPLATGITIVRDDLEDYGLVASDSSGYFWATGLNFRDSAQIAIAALDEKLRPLGKVELIPFTPPGYRGSFPRLNYQTVPIPTQAEPLLDTSGDYILLEEFVKEENRERETMADRNYGYGDPNQEVGEKDLETKTWAEILGLLRFNMSTLKFRNFTYGERTGSPLLIIDGVSMPFLEPEDFRARVLGYEPSQLKSIKVYNDNISNVVFGMAGYSGVLMIETKNGFRTGPDSDRKFNSEGFQIFPVRGYSSFPEFPKNPPADSYLKMKPTIYWDPLAKTENGVYKVKIKLPYGLKGMNLKVEGTTEDGEAIYQIILIEF